MKIIWYSWIPYKHLEDPGGPRISLRDFCHRETPTPGCRYKYVHSSMSIQQLLIETAQMFTYRGMDKQCYAHIVDGYAAVAMN